MSKKLTLTMTLALSAMLIAACGQGDDKKAKEAEQEPIEIKSEEQTTADTVEKEPAKESTATQEDGQKAEENTAPTASPETKTEAPKETVSATGTASTQMPYVVTLQDGFTFTAEEPGRDQIISAADSGLSMRIQVATTEEDTFASVKDNAMMYMQAVGEPTELSANELAPLANATGWKTTFDNDVVYVIAFEQNGLVGQLTIYDKANASAIASFLQMASTITKK